jgi:hypothetical protein
MRSNIAGSAVKSKYENGSISAVKMASVKEMAAESVAK